LSEHVPLRATRAVLLDLDDTLITEEAHAHSVVRGTAAIAGVEPGVWEKIVFGTARAAWHASSHHLVCSELGISSWEGLWATFEGGHRLVAGLRDFAMSYREQVWTSACEAADTEPVLASQLSHMYIEGQRSGHPLAPGAEELVRRAVSVGQIALVTNGPPDIQRLKLDQTGLAEHFSAVVVSGEIGLGKPDPEVFLQTVSSLGVRPEEAVMVGDSWERDVEGAVGAGLSAIWISHGRDAPRSDPKVRVAEGAGDVRFF
jgi:HAD superfamily hydrolase (TIGR01549 family)